MNECKALKRRVIPTQPCFVQFSRVFSGTISSSDVSVFALCPLCPLCLCLIRFVSLSFALCPCSSSFSPSHAFPYNGPVTTRYLFSLGSLTLFFSLHPSALIRSTDRHAIPFSLSFTSWSHTPPSFFSSSFPFFLFFFFSSLNSHPHPHPYPIPSTPLLSSPLLITTYIHI